MRRQQLFSLLTLLLMAATGAWAQGTVDSKKGTVDADKWTIKSGETTVEPGVTEVNEGDPVTITYSGTRHVKSVTAIVTPWLNVNKLSEITDAIAALNMEPGGEYTLTVTFDPTKIETNPAGDDNKLYMSIPDDATLNLVFKNTLPDGTQLTIGDAAYAGMTLDEVDDIFRDQPEPESKNKLNLDFAGGTGSEDVDGSGLYLTLVTPTSTVSLGSSTGNVWFEEVIIYTGADSFFSKLGSCVKKAVVKVGKTVASVATTVGKTVAKAAKTVVKKVVNLVVTKIIKPAVEQLVEKIKQNIVQEPLIPTVITATPSNIIIFENHSFQFDVKVVLGNDGMGGDITFASSDPNIASVDNSGRVTGLFGGIPGSPKYVTITATIGSGGKKATRECKVGVEETPRASEISFSMPTVSVPKDRAIIIEPEIVIGNDAASQGAFSYRLSYKSSNPAVATVNEFGYVRGHQMGDATITANYGPLSTTITVTVTASVDGMTHVLDNVNTGFIVENGDVLTGTLKGNYKIEIADGATVTLDNATISGEDGSYGWAGLTCNGDATIILKDGTTNFVKGFESNYPGIFVPKEKTLTIQGGTEGTGSLTASSNGNSAGIGCGGYGPDYVKGGNIVIKGGNITAIGGDMCSGIGAYADGKIGNITISGGTVNATGGKDAPGIGGGVGSCGDITITSDVTKVTATKGNDYTGSIGIGDLSMGTCGTITIGGTVYWDGTSYQNGGDSYLRQSPFVYEPGQ